MKKLLFLLMFTAISACKNDMKQASDSADLKELKGEFVYLADAAVLQTSQEIYGVIINEKMHELDDMVKPYKKEDTDMVPVSIKGKIIPKPEGEEGWDYRVEIVEILGVSKPTESTNNVIKLGE